MFRRTPAWTTVVCLARIVIPFSRSRSPESMTRSTTAWFDRKAPVWRSIASTSVVLPWSTWATIATLRRSARISLGPCAAGAADVRVVAVGVVASGTGGYCSKDEWDGRLSHGCRTAASGAPVSFGDGPVRLVPELRSGDARRESPLLRVRARSATARPRQWLRPGPAVPGDHAGCGVRVL